MFMSVCNTFVYEECVRMMMMVLSRTSLLTAMPHVSDSPKPTLIMMTLSRTLLIMMTLSRTLLIMMTLSRTFYGTG